MLQNLLYCLVYMFVQRTVFVQRLVNFSLTLIQNYKLHQIGAGCTPEGASHLIFKIKFTTALHEKGYHVTSSQSAQKVCFKYT